MSNKHYSLVEFAKFIIIVGFTCTVLFLTILKSEKMAQSVTNTQNCQPVQPERYLQCAVSIEIASLIL